MAKSVPNRAPRGYEFELHGNYGYGWDHLTTESTRSEILNRKKEYEANEKGASYKIKRVKAEE